MIRSALDSDDGLSSALDSSTSTPPSDIVERFGHGQPAVGAEERTGRKSLKPQQVVSLMNIFVPKLCTRIKAA